MAEPIVVNVRIAWWAVWLFRLAAKWACLMWRLRLWNEEQALGFAERSGTWVADHGVKVQ